MTILTWLFYAGGVLVIMAGAVALALLFPLLCILFLSFFTHTLECDGEARNAKPK